eukprot:74682-Chlamydomonas_euryale.AAC.1
MRSFIPHFLQGSSDASWRMKHVHHGHVTALVWADGRDANIGGTFLSGGQDGCVGTVAKETILIGRDGRVAAVEETGRICCWDLGTEGQVEGSGVGLAHCLG